MLTYSKPTRPLYECDPVLNTECKKTQCFEHGGDCHRTSNPAFSRDAKSVYSTITAEPSNKAK